MAEDTKVVSDKQEWYIGMDGDDMGKEVENALIDNDIAESQKFEKRIKGAFAEIEEYITEKGGKLIFNGGDNILFTIDGDPKEIGEEVRDIYFRHTDHTATVGIGREPVEAHKALTIGKNTGKDKVVIWNDGQEKVYDDIKNQQEELESCEEEIREDSDLEVGASPALKYRAEAHYRRLLGMGYDPKVAQAFVSGYYYKGAASFRDMLMQRKKQPLVGQSAAERFLREGEVAWEALMAEAERQKEASTGETEATPVLEQKFVCGRGIGMVRFVGSRFVSVEWLDGKRERIALKNFRRAVESDEYKLVPKIRVARRQNAEVRREG